MLKLKLKVQITLQKPAPSPLDATVYLILPTLFTSCHNRVYPSKKKRLPKGHATMHSSIVRIQNVFGFFTTVAFVVAALIAASDLIAPRTPSANVAVKDVQVYVALVPPLPNSPSKTSRLIATAEFEADHITTLRKKKNTP